MQLPFPQKVFTERLILQRLRYEDAEEIFYTYASKPEVTKYLSWPTHRSVDDTRGFLNYAINGWNNGTDFSFSIRLKQSRMLIGSFGFINDQGKLQFGYALSPTFWGNGFATEVCRTMMEMAKQMNGVYRINTFVDVDNVKSVNVLKKSGLQYEATLRNWFRFVNQNNAPKDCILMYLPLDKK
jgi:[ribosomal protein S5]-alanine N-acetyltransferase